MAEAETLTELLRRPEVVAAVDELGIVSLGVEDILTALRHFGGVRIDVDDDPARPYTCVLEIPGEHPESARGATVLHAALSCWAATLEGTRRYADLGLEQVTRFLAGADEI